MREIKLQQNLNFLIREQGRPLSRVAHSSQMNKSTLHGYLNGVVPRSLKSLIELSKTLGVSPQDLLFEDLTRSSCSPDVKKDKDFLGGRFEITIKPIQSGEKA